MHPRLRIVPAHLTACSLLLFLALTAIGCGSGSGGTTDASLAMLAASAGPLDPAFDEDTLAYTVFVGSATTTTTLTPTPSDVLAGVTVNGAPVASGAPSPPIALPVGPTELTVAVTAQDGATREYKVTVVRFASIDLIDPTPGTDNEFGRKVTLLTNGNIVVTDPFDSSVAAESGAVHLYGPSSNMPIASLYGDAAKDQLGVGGVIALPNGN